MYIIGHRGAMGHAPENTLAGISKAIELGANAVEIDIRPTRDGKIILYHNAVTPDGHVVSERTLKTLRREQKDLATLDEAMDIAGKTQLIVESKAVGTFAKSIKVLAKTSNVWTASFLPDEVLASRINLPHHKSFLLKSCPAGIIGKAKNIDANGIGCNWIWFVLMPYYYKIATKNKLSIYIYPLNIAWIAKLLLKYFPDLLIVTDYPDNIRGIQ